MARDLLARVKPNAAGLMFVSANGKTAVSGWSRLKDRLDKAMVAAAHNDKPDAVIEPWRLHDLRRSAVTGMVELGVPPHVVEQVVNHLSGTRASVAGTYNRSTLLPERKAALERWAAQIEGLVSGQSSDKVVPMRRASRE